VLQLESKNCPVCDAQWFEGQLYWATGKPGNDLDLNALVCRNLCSEKFEKCINPLKGEEGGIGWAERSNFIEKELARALDGI